jgi:hypothetical protein
MRQQDITGIDAMPFLLGRIVERTGGQSLEANNQLVLNNARVAAGIAVEFTIQSRSAQTGSRLHHSCTLTPPKKRTLDPLCQLENSALDFRMRIFHARAASQANLWHLRIYCMP